MGHHRPASETPFKWRFASEPMVAQGQQCWLGSFVNFQGIWTSIAKKLYIFKDFSGGRGIRTPRPPPLWIRPWSLLYYYTKTKSSDMGDFIKFEPVFSIRYQLAYAFTEDSNQPEPPHSLIRVLVFRLKKC